jgi:aerobic-type carbon monoxide dehydrogenase small subunit (CoxS/CutS family)
MPTITMTVNGDLRTLEVAGHRPLLDVLREDLGLTGTKECCAVGECGACTVVVDGMSVNSCLMLAVEADGARVTTVEGLARDGQPSAVQDAFLEHGAVQCGFCIPGMIISAQQLLNANPAPTVEDVREALSGNLCRCAGYNRIIAAVLAAAYRAGGSPAGPPTDAEAPVREAVVTGQVDQ